MKFSSAINMSQTTACMGICTKKSLIPLNRQYNLEN